MPFVRCRLAVFSVLLAVTACGGGGSPDAGLDAGAPEGDAGSATDAGLPGTDAGLPVPPVVIERSLFWNQPAILDDPGVVSFARLMALTSDDGHGGRVLEQWFHRFATTAHSERALPSQFIDGVIATQGADASQWDLSALPFKVTGLHNRIDLADLSAGGHCGEFRASVSSTDPTLQPFHALFLFRQPLGDGDVVAGRVTCEGTARRWAALSALEGDALLDGARAAFTASLTRSRFLMIETVEFTLSPWEWRQWLPEADGRLENPPLFQQLDVARLNTPGALRDDFLGWVRDNAAALEARALLLPERFRPPSTRITQGVPREPLRLDPALDTARPTLRQQLELVGCAACHTADAEFVQTRTDRTVSPFYEKELRARATHLERLARGEAPVAPFGPLQASPVLPP
jgi:mono/diheme cytochrome c family protein